ncbi:CLUMA_CG017246, isoform A [Clunio marinus]|uniref:CLUMA_CG017246, isoform A n=1 Tax=Clunio marinus TaxID=568069 RepID=A0A1J1IVD7_9DIPT|nr:CLUMA_CG017246, isoform A [Clunio marinus]
MTRTKFDECAYAKVGFETMKQITNISCILKCAFNKATDDYQLKSNSFQLDSRRKTNQSMGRFSAVRELFLEKEMNCATKEEKSEIHLFHEDTNSYAFSTQLMTKPTLSNIKCNFIVFER